MTTPYGSKDDPTKSKEDWSAAVDDEKTAPTADQLKEKKKIIPPTEFKTSPGLYKEQTPDHTLPLILRQIELKIRTQTVRTASIQNIVDQLQEENIENFSITRLDAMSVALSVQWDQFSRYHERMIEDGTAELLDHDYFHEDAYGLTSAMHDNALGIISVLKGKLSSREKTQTDGRGSHSGALTRIPIPQFGGKYSEWKGFADLFQSLVGKQPHIPAVEKMARLKAAVKDEARSLIVNLEVTNENYEVAWKALTDRYDNRRLIINSHLNRLANLPQMTSSSQCSLMTIIDTFKEALDALKALGCPVEHWDIMIVHRIRNLLDTKTKKLWERELGSSTDPPTLAEFLDFLISIARAE